MAILEKLEFKKSNLMYELVEERKDIEDYGLVTVYGIKITEKKNGYEYSKAISDISANRQKVEGLLEKIKRAKLKPDFLLDIVEDFLVEEYAG